MKEKMYICNKMGNSSRCNSCEHNEPHILVTEGETKCTKWVECIEYNGTEIKVRCVEVK